MAGHFAPDGASVKGLWQCGRAPSAQSRHASRKVRPNGWNRRAVSTKVGLLPSQTGGNSMGIESIIVWLIVGAIAGWLAGLIVKGGGFGLLGNIVIGIIGAVVAGWLLPTLGVHLGTGIIGAIIDSVIGAVVVLVIISLIKRA
jgi:uncharacterized membrane protein YeaQ/YmgE (transglycosylase-associated protein family)